MKLENYTFGDIVDLQAISMRLAQQAMNAEQHIVALNKGELEVDDKEKYLEFARQRFQLYERLAMSVDNLTLELLAKTFLPETSTEKKKEYTDNVIEGNFGDKQHD